MAREIVLDTETTGLDPRRGDRLVEIACIELQDLLPTGRTFHRYINPERDMPIEAEKVHGLSAKFLADKPKFGEADVCEAFLEFVGDAVIVAHNAGFDRGFVNFELEQLGREGLRETRWLDTLGLAQKRFPGMYNSLDALCKRFKISLAEREKHGALIDARLLAEVYLELRGGRERGLELTPQTVRATVAEGSKTQYGERPRALPARSTDEERAAHAEFIRANLKEKALWLKLGLVEL
jgi:DNA polymerase-3 subunit epsilon